jgi:hypothetical protein
MNVNQNKEYKDLFKILVSQGFTIERTKKGHYKIVSPPGANLASAGEGSSGVYILSGTPRSSDVTKFKATLKRMGAKL